MKIELLKEKNLTTLGVISVGECFSLEGDMIQTPPPIFIKTDSSDRDRAPGCCNLTTGKLLFYPRSQIVVLHHDAKVVY